MGSDQNYARDTAPAWSQRRNLGQQLCRGGVGRFNYDDFEAELEAPVPSIAGLTNHAPQLQVIFNNNYEDQGQRSAKTVEKIISGGVYKKPRRA